MWHENRNSIKHDCLSWLTHGWSSGDPQTPKWGTWDESRGKKRTLIDLINSCSKQTLGTASFFVVVIFALAVQGAVFILSSFVHSSLSIKPTSSSSFRYQRTERLIIIYYYDIIIMYYCYILSFYISLWNQPVLRRSYTSGPRGWGRASVPRGTRTWPALLRRRTPDGDKPWFAFQVN